MDDISKHLTEVEKNLKTLNHIVAHASMTEDQLKAADRELEQAIEHLKRARGWVFVKSMGWPLAARFGRIS